MLKDLIIVLVAVIFPPPSAPDAAPVAAHKIVPTLEVCVATGTALEADIAERFPGARVAWLCLKASPNAAGETAPDERAL